MADLSVTGEVVVNSEQAESAFSRVGDAAQGMANEVATSAGKAGQAVDKIGDGAGQSAEKFTRAESRISAAIKKSTTELELLGKTASQKLEFNISDKGLDPKKFEPMLQRLRDVEEQSRRAQQVATGSLDSMGMSAKATAAALRGIPAQFQDIVVSLQGGQAPMTVFLQQGSQLSGMFGGAGAAAKAFGGYVLGLVTPFTIAAAAAATLAVAYYQGRKEADAYTRSIALSGNAAGTTGAQLQQMAARISASVGTQGAAADVLAQLVGTGKVAAQNLEQFAGTAVRLDRVGIAVKDTVKDFAELGKAPVEASKKLNDSYGYLTAAVFEQIKALDGQGRALEAAAVAQQAYDRGMNAATSTLEGQLGSLERGWLAVAGAAKKGWDAMLNVGRSDSLGDQLGKVRAELEARMARQQGRPDSFDEKGNEKLRQQIGLLTEQERVMKRGAEAQAARTQAEKDGIAAAEALQKTQDKGLTKQQQMNKALEDYRKQLADLRATNPSSERLAPSAVARGESSIREQFADKGALAAINKEQSAYESLIASIRTKIEEAKQELTGNRALSESQKMRIKLDEELLSGKLKLTGADKARSIAALEELAAQEKLAVAAKEALKVSQERQSLREKETSGIAAWFAAEEAAATSALASARDRVKSLVDEQQALVLSTTANISLAEAVERVAQARLLEKQQQFVEGSEGYINIQKEIDARKELLGLISSNEANKKFLDEWKQSVSQYDDIFRKGFADMLNNGKNGWKSFTKSLATTFKTAVADQIYKMFAQPFVMKLVASLIGVTGGGVAASAAGAVTGGSGASTALSAASLFGAGGIGGSLAAGAGWLTGATTLGGSLTAGASLLGTGTLAGAASGLGVIAGALGPIALGIGAIYSIWKKLDTSGTYHTGGAGSYSAAGGANTGAKVLDQGLTFGVRYKDYNKQAEGAAVDISKTIVSILDSTATAFGKNAGYFAATAFADDSSKDGAWGSLIIKGPNGKVIDWADTQTSKWAPKVFSDGEAGQKEYAAALAMAVKDALAAAVGDVSWAKDLVGGLSDTASFEEVAAVAQQINVIKAAFVQLGEAITGFAGLTDDAFGAIMNASGGIANLTANAAKYYDNFYTAEEKKADVQKKLGKGFAELGITDAPKTRDEYRKLVDEALAKADQQSKGRASIIAGITGLSAAGIGGLSGTSLASGIPAGLLGSGAADPANAGKLNSFVSDLDKLLSSGASASDMQAGVASLVDMNAAILGIDEDAAKTAAGLLALSDTFAGLNESADETAARLAKEQSDARDAAYRGLERAIAAEKEALQSQIDIASGIADTMSGLFDILHSNVRDLYGEVDSTKTMQAQQGNAFITQALATARASGYLPDATQLSEAISGARGGLDQNNFKSGSERDYAALVLAGQLKGLEDITGRQLTDAQRTVKELEGQTEQLDKTLSYWREQIDIANGTYEATVSVADAIAVLTALMFPGKGEAAPNKPGTVTGAGGAGGITWGGGTAVSKYQKPVNVGGSTVYVGVGQDEEKRLDKIATGYHAFDNTGDAAGLNKWIAENNIKPGDLSALSGLYEQDWVKWFQANGLPSFAVGTNYVPRDMLAQIHEGEAIIPKAYNPAANAGMGGNTQRMESLLAEINTKLEELKGLQGDGNEHAGATRDLIDRVSAGGNSLAVDVMNKPTVEVAA